MCGVGGAESMCGTEPSDTVVTGDLQGVRTEQDERGDRATVDGHTRHTAHTTRGAATGSGGFAAELLPVDTRTTRLGRPAAALPSVVAQVILVPVVPGWRYPYKATQVPRPAPV
ncbi:hypothetical protein Aglo01_45760 [Actinokineospora globicatena]|nr:hypothetical protein Aglo01_45760 [Actinokineospora globicatena]GLW86924.1 hypothetical protein Aglo02_45630 [Actinokineospora globicatena]